MKDKEPIVDDITDEVVTLGRNGNVSDKELAKACGNLRLGLKFSSVF